MNFAPTVDLYTNQDSTLIGPRSFGAETAASCSSFLRDPSSQAAKTLFIRSLRKLQARFSPVLMENDPKLGKISAVLQSLEEGLNELEIIGADTENQPALEKLCGSLVKDATKLEDEGMSDTIPINHIRRASYWCRLAPNGKRKTLIIENADKMREEARNSLLKLLEEPPDTVSIVLTSQRREAIMATILSRLRPYRFLKRDAESEKKIIRRVFRDAQAVFTPASASGGSLISAYLDSFLPRSAEKLYPLAAYFLACLARAAFVSLKKKRAAVPEIVTAIGVRYTPIAKTTGFEESVNAAVIIKTLLAKSGNFEDDSFSRFLKTVLDMVSQITREAQNPQYIAYNDKIKKYINEAETAVGVLNQNTTVALEALFRKLKTTLTGDLHG
jgi:DNA polymerase-3 subunit gamma/tau